MAVPDLWQARPDLLAQAASRWAAFGSALGARHGELTRLVLSVGGGWEGIARDAAIAQLTCVAERMAGDRALVEQIAPVLEEHSSVVASAQRLLHGAVATTRGTPLTISPDGSVRLAPSALVLGLTNPVLLAALVVQARAVALAIGRALEMATESDELTATRLAELTPRRPSREPPGGSGAARIPPAGTSPQRVAAWWDGLSPAERHALIHTDPEAIGNLDGIPAQVRDEANRLRLPGERDALSDQATRLQAAVAAGDPTAAARLEQVQNKLRALDAIDDTLARGDRQLLLLDTGGRRVKAAVAIGNVDTADHVAVFTPGFTSTVEDSLPSYDDKMDLLRRQAQDESDRFGDGGSVAAVTWIGYEAPQLSEVTDLERSVASDDQARTGGAALGRFLDGVDAARPEDPHLTAIGHSYGSTTTGHAVQHAGSVDDVIFYGSPGIGTSDAGDLHVTEGHSYVIEARNDFVADLGRFGDDPNQLDGLTDLSSGAARTPDGRELSEVTGHSNYLAPDSTSQHNMSVVVAGVEDRAIYGENTGLGDHAREFVDDAGEVIGGVADKVRDIVPGI